MRWLLLLGVVASCRVDLDSPDKVTGGVDAGDANCKVTTSAVCLEAVSHSDFTWLNTNLFNTNCGGTSCHQANSDSNAKKNPYGDLAMTYASLVNFESNVNPGVKLVVAGQPSQSYLLVMLNHLAPANFSPPLGAVPSDPGLMPQNSGTLCCQKLDAVQRWIEAGAPMQ
jgi:hypothetical protein